MIRLHTPMGARQQSRSQRRGFTIVELVVVVGIIIALVALSVTAYVRILASSKQRETSNTLSVLDAAVAEYEQEAKRDVSWAITLTGPRSADMTLDVPHLWSVSQLMESIGRVESVKEILAQLTPKNTYRYTGNDPTPTWLLAATVPDINDPNLGRAKAAFNSGTAGNGGDLDLDDALVVLDAWGTPIRAVHPGRVWVTSDGAAYRNEDGTVFVNTGFTDSTGAVPEPRATEHLYGVAEGRRIYFVSAGPDGLFGDLADDIANGVAGVNDGPSADNIWSYEVGLP